MNFKMWELFSGSPGISLGLSGKEAGDLRNLASKFKKDDGYKIFF